MPPIQSDAETEAQIFAEALIRRLPKYPSLMTRRSVNEVISIAYPRWYGERISPNAPTIARIMEIVDEHLALEIA